MNIASKIVALQYRRDLLIQYLNSQVSVEDWHGVSDAANDLREIEIEIKCAKERNT